MWFDFDRTVAITLTDVSEARSVLTSSLESFSDLEIFRAFAIHTLRSQHILQYTHLCRIPSPPSFSHTHTHTHTHPHTDALHQNHLETLWHKTEPLSPRVCLAST